MKNTLQAAVMGALFMGVGVVACPQQAWAQQASPRAYAIDAGDLDTALTQWASQNGVQLIYSADLVAGKKTNGLSGSYELMSGLKAILSGSSLEPQRVNQSTILLKKNASPGPKPEAKNAGEAESDDVVSMSKVAVVEERWVSRNVDVQRSEDDAMPYVIIQREDIERTGATTMSEFMRRLPQNTSPSATNAAAGVVTEVTAPHASGVNLRGLGLNSTLILVNGRRLPDGVVSFSAAQGDLNAIPIAAVERIEYLPGSAGAIYGASAVGGVINIILRSDYRAWELSATYGNRSGMNAAKRQVQLAGGTTFNEGNTQWIVALNWNQNDSMTNNDGGYAARATEAIRARNPGLYTAGPNPPLSSTPNITAERFGDPLPVLGVPFASVPAGSIGNTPAHQLVPGFNTDSTGTYGTVALGGGGLAWLFPEQEMRSMSSTLSHKFGDSVEGSLQLNMSENEGRLDAGLQTAGTSIRVPAHNPHNPFGTAALGADGVPVRVSASTLRDVVDATRGKLRTSYTKTWGATAALRGDLDGGWKWNADTMLGNTTRGVDILGLYTNVDQAMSGTIPGLEGIYYNPFIDPASGVKNDQRLLDSMIRQARQEWGSRLVSSALRMAGPVDVGLPAGEIHLSTGAEWRRETAYGYWTRETATMQDILLLESSDPNRKNRVWAGYLEARIPLLAGGPRLGEGMTLLEATTGLRYENHSGYGGKAVPSVALRFQPLRSMAFRASFSEGYTPPGVDQTGPSNWNSEPQTIIDPARNQSYEVAAGDVTVGGNPELQPELADSYGIGVIFEPQFLPGLRMSLDWYRIERSQRISSLNAATVLANEALLPGRVTRAAPTAEDVALGRPGMVTALDLRPINLNAQDIEGYDLNLRYRFDTRFGQFDINSMASYAKRFESQVAIGSQMRDDVGWPFRLYGAPLKLRGNTSIYWTRDAFSVGLTGRYLDGYSITSNASVDLVTGGHVASSTEFDLQISWDAGWQFGGFLSRTRFTLGVDNLLDRMPPFYLQDIINGPRYSTLNDPRRRVIYLTMHKAF